MDYPPGERPYIRGYNAGVQDHYGDHLNPFEGKPQEDEWMAGYKDGEGDRLAQAAEYGDAGPATVIISPPSGPSADDFLGWA